MLKQILSELKDALAEASVAPELTDPKVQAGAFAIKRNAERRVEELTKQYKNEVQSTIKIIAIVGKYGEDFANIAESKYKTITHNYLSVLEQLSDAIKNRTPRDTFASQEYWMLLDELNKIKYRYEIEVLPAPQLNTDDHNANTDIRTAVKDLLERTMGNDLYAVTALKQICDKAFNAKSSAEILPVVVYNYQPTESLFLPQPVGTIEINNPVTEESVKEALIEIKEKLSGNIITKPKKQKPQITNEE